MTVSSLLLLLAGLALLVAGAEGLVRGASRLARRLGISPLIVGLTVVAFGTSSPEMAVSVQSALAGQADLALGNVVGSNIFNVLFILGLSAAIAPLVVAMQLVRLDVPVMIASSLLLVPLAWDGAIGRGEGLLLFAGIVAYTAFLIVKARRGETPAVEAEFAGEYPAPAPRRGGWIVEAALVLGGLALLVLGSRWLVAGAVEIARALGVSELVIGLTLVAAGTSLPEVATSVLATIRGERDIAVGNVVGSNVFNVLAVLGLAAVVAPSGVAVSESVLRFDLPVMIAVAVACLPIFFTGFAIARWEGWLFLGYYVAYVAYLILSHGHPATLPLFETVMAGFVLPLTAVTLAVIAGREWRRHGTRAG